MQFQACLTLTLLVAYTNMSSISSFLFYYFFLEFLSLKDVRLIGEVGSENSIDILGTSLLLVHDLVDQKSKSMKLLSSSFSVYLDFFHHIANSSLSLSLHLLYDFFRLNSSLWKSYIPFLWAKVL